MVCTNNTYSQSPDRIPYQSVIRNSTGALLADKAVGLRISMQRARSIHSHVQVISILTNSIKFLIEGKEFRHRALPLGLADLQQFFKS